MENGNENVEQKTKQTVNEKDYQAEIERLKEENRRLKSATDNACADASEWKKKFRATQTEAERKAAEQEERIASIEAENIKYKTAERTLKYKTKLMESGYDSETASSMAANLPDGITDSFFEQQKAFYEQKKREIMAEIINKQPDITPGISPTSQSVEEGEY